MFKRSLRIKVMVAMFSVAFLAGGQNNIMAYTFDGADDVWEGDINTKNDNATLQVGWSKGNANVRATDNIAPKTITTKKTETGKYVTTTDSQYQISAAGTIYKNSKIKDANGNTLIELGDNPTDADVEKVKEFLTKIFPGKDNIVWDRVYDSDTKQYTLVHEHIGHTGKQTSSHYYMIDSVTITASGIKYQILEKDFYGLIDDSSIGDPVDLGYLKLKTYVTYIPEVKTENIEGPGYVRVENYSKLYGEKALIAKQVKLGNNSIISLKGDLVADILNADGISFEGTGHQMQSVANIIAGSSSENIPSFSNDKYEGESYLIAKNISITWEINTSGNINAIDGSIKGNRINATGGNILSKNSIIAGTKIKANSLNVNSVNAKTTTFDNELNVSGQFQAQNQAVFKNGISMNGTKITDLADGDINGINNMKHDAVTGRQLWKLLTHTGLVEGEDISISSENRISVSKAGKVTSGNTGIMTGDAVYQETSKIDNAFKANNASITSNNSKLDSLTTSIEGLRKSLGTINSSVSDAISGLPGSLANFANKDLTDLSDTGINTLKSYIKSEIKKQIPSNSKTASYAIEATVTKDTSAIDNVIASKANASDLNALGNKVDGKADKADVSSFEDTVNAKAELSYVNDGLAKKADQSVIEAVSSDVDRNTSAIAKNTDLIQSNTEAISELNDSKADVSGSNIDVSSWTNKLGTGTVAKDDSDLVTGSSVASALDKKADIGYVAMGLGSMESGLDQMSQQVIKDVSRVGAGASALMGLHPTGDKFEFATAYGHYKNSNNTALGVFYKPSANSTVSMAGTIGDGDAMLSAGVSIKLGLNKEVKKVITPEEFGKMKSAVDSQDEKLDQMEKTLQQLMAR